MLNEERRRLIVEMLHRGAVYSLRVWPATFGLMTVWAQAAAVVQLFGDGILLREVQRFSGSPPSVALQSTPEL